MKLLCFLLMISAILMCGCYEDYDVEEVAPSEHLVSTEGHDCSDDEPGEHSPIDETSPEASVPGHSSGHSHGVGERNHGTQWFFNQPWAAPFIWGKLARDGSVFLALSVVIFLVSGRRKR